jgi:hypothetical protein
MPSRAQGVNPEASSLILQFGEEWPFSPTIVKDAALFTTSWR